MATKTLVIQIKFHGEEADFIRAAAIPNKSEFGRRALRAAAGAATGKPCPVSAPLPRGAQKGSKIELARELGLSTKEYKRRVRVVEASGQPVSAETVRRVPAAVKRAA